MRIGLEGVMVPLADPERIEALCRQFGVARLELFGSAARGTDFDPEHSDIDLLLTYGAEVYPPSYGDYLALREGLEAAFGRKVDLVMRSALTNPYLIKAIEEEARPLYAA